MKRTMTPSTIFFQNLWSSFIIITPFIPKRIWGRITTSIFYGAVIKISTSLTLTFELEKVFVSDIISARIEDYFSIIITKQKPPINPLATDYRGFALTKGAVIKISTSPTLNFELENIRHREDLPEVEYC